jgi:hypothetical protein
MQWPSRLELVDITLRFGGIITTITWSDVVRCIYSFSNGFSVRLGFWSNSRPLSMLDRKYG